MTLPQARILVASALACAYLPATSARELVAYHPRRNAIAARCHGKGRLTTHGSLACRSP
ncbi:MAG: hypothetical protein AB1445_05685 [Bacillota bacterium]